MNANIAGIVAGLIATAVLSALMLLKGMMGVMPDLDVIALIAGMMVPVATLMLHVIFGAVLGISFAKLTGEATSS
tara:strand:- start:18422 stop:18646 length:225 start_codon:yes stop_codon:yes gene_type:complete